jgi:very-short-patch-repair endonuclease
MSGPYSPTLNSPELSAELARPWTRAEREVWRILEQGLLGYTFRRHAVLNGVLVGFYCPELGLVLALIDEDRASSGPSLESALAGLNLKIARLSAANVSRPNLVEAVEAVVVRGRLWPED